MEETSKLSTNKITISYIQIINTMQSLYTSTTHLIAFINYKTSQCVCIFRRSTHTQRTWKTLSFINMQMLIENFQSVLMLSTSIHYKLQKSRGLLLWLIMGLGGHDNWVRDEFLVALRFALLLWKSKARKCARVQNKIYKTRTPAIE